MDRNPLSINEIEKVFFSLKVNKGAESDEISVSYVGKYFSKIINLLKHTFELNSTVIFQKKLK